MPDVHDLLCVVCSAPRGSIGRLVQDGGLEAVACRNPGCLDLLIRGVREIETPYAANLLDAAGKAGGAKLMQIGITDVRTLSREQWLAFVAEIVGGWRAAAAQAAWESMNGGLNGGEGHGGH